MTLDRPFASLQISTINVTKKGRQETQYACPTYLAKHLTLKLLNQSAASVLTRGAPPDCLQDTLETVQSIYTLTLGPTASLGRIKNAFEVQSSDTTTCKYGQVVVQG